MDMDRATFSHYTDADRHKKNNVRQTDRQTDNSIMPIDRSAVRSAKNPPCCSKKQKGAKTSMYGPAIGSCPKK